MKMGVKQKDSKKAIGIKSRPSWFKLKYLKEIGETGILKIEMERRLASINQQKNKVEKMGSSLM